MLFKLGDRVQLKYDKAVPVHYSSESELIKLEVSNFGTVNEYKYCDYPAKLAPFSIFSPAEWDNKYRSEFQGHQIYGIIVDIQNSFNLFHLDSAMYNQQKPNEFKITIKWRGSSYESIEDLSLFEKS